MRVSEIVRHAKQTMLEHGWTQHRMVNDRGEVCILGALDITFYENRSRMSLADLATAIHSFNKIFNRSGDFFQERSLIARWNDSGHRTPEEVLEAFDKVIVAAEFEEGVIAVLGPITAPEEVLA